MDRYGQLLVAASSIFLFPACDQIEESRKRTVEALISEFQVSAASIHTIGAPRLTWSNAELNRFKSALDVCETNLGKIEDLNGTNGIALYGAWTLAELRAFLKEIRNVADETLAEMNRLKGLIVQENRQSRPASPPRFMVA